MKLFQDINEDVSFTLNEMERITITTQAAVSPTGINSVSVNLTGYDKLFSLDLNSDSTLGTGTKANSQNNFLDDYLTAFQNSNRPVNELDPERDPYQRNHIHGQDDSALPIILKDGN